MPASSVTSRFENNGFSGPRLILCRLWEFELMTEPELLKLVEVASNLEAQEAYFVKTLVEEWGLSVGLVAPG